MPAAEPHGGLPHDGPPNDTLIDALGLVGEVFHTEPGPLVAGGLSRGRRLRRRRATALAGGASALLLVGAAGVGLTLGGPAHSAAVVTTTASDSPGPSASTGATAPPSTLAPPVTGDRMVALLKSLLPPGQVVSTNGRGTAADSSGITGSPLADVVYDDGHGKALVTVAVSRPYPGQAVTGCPDKTLVTYDSCTTGRQPDNSVLTLLQGYEYPDKRLPTKMWSAYLVRPDGGMVEADEWNAPADKGSAVSRPNPPLTLAQLTAIVTDAGGWDPVLAAIAPQGPAGSTSQRPPTMQSMTKDEMLGTLLALLPNGLQPSGGDGQQGYVHLTLNDGKGASLVQVNVQQWSRGMELPGSVTTLPDGTELVLDPHADAGGTGVLEWSADVLRPDGTRVVVSATDSSRPSGGVDRTAPALTMDQLQAIALSPRWQLHPVQE